MTHIPSPLLGCAVADAMGMPWEFASPDSLALCSWKGGFADGKHHGLRAGQYTDDTQLSIALAESLVEKGRFDGEDVAARYLRLYRKVGIRGIGGTTRDAMERLGQGLPWTESGLRGRDRAGNGTAMRVAPIGLFFKGTSEPILSSRRFAAAADAATTHNNEEAIAGSLAVAEAVAFLRVAGVSGYPQIAVQPVMVAAAKIMRPTDTVRLLEAVDEKLEPFEARVLYAPGGGFYVAEAVALACYCFISTGTYLAAVERAVRMGGDADTVAAITGALAGTYYGRDGIPADLAAQVEDSAKLMALDEALGVE